MAEPQASPLAADMKRCVVCGEPINEAARKCVHCQAYQGRLRRSLGGIGPILSMLGVVAGLVAAAWAGLNFLVTPRHSHLVPVVQASTDEVVAVLVANDGARPGTVGWAQISFEDQAFGLSAEGGLPVVVDAGKSVLIRFKSSEPVRTLDKFRNFLQMPDNFRCKFVLGQTDSAGQQSGIELPLSCGHAASVLGLL